MPERITIASYKPFAAQYDEDQEATKLKLVLPSVWISLPRKGMASIIIASNVGFYTHPTIDLSFETPVNVGEFVRNMEQTGIAYDLEFWAKEYASEMSKKIGGLGDDTLERMNLIGMLNSLGGEK